MESYVKEYENEEMGKRRPLPEQFGGQTGNAEGVLPSTAIFRWMKFFPSGHRNSWHEKLSMKRRFWQIGRKRYHAGCLATLDHIRYDFRYNLSLNRRSIVWKEMPDEEYAMVAQRF